MKEQEFIKQLYEEEPNLGKEGLENFAGYFVHYDKVIKAVCNAWGGENPGYNNDPLELIGNLINERDEILASLKAWAESRKEAETAARPDVNIYKRILVETWNQIIRELDKRMSPYVVLPGVGGSSEWEKIE